MINRIDKAKFTSIVCNSTFQKAQYNTLLEHFEHALAGNKNQETYLNLKDTYSEDLIKFYKNFLAIKMTNSQRINKDHDLEDIKSNPNPLENNDMIDSDTMINTNDHNSKSCQSGNEDLKKKPCTFRELVEFNADPISIVYDSVKDKFSFF